MAYTAAVIYKENDLVLIRFKRGAKLARIRVVYPNGKGYGLEVWRNASRTWTRPTWRDPHDVIGYASQSERKLWGYEA